MLQNLPIPQIQCNKGINHYGELINTVCLNKACIDKGDFLLCIVCSNHFHEQHEQIPAKLLLNEITLCLNKNLKQDNILKEFQTQRNNALQIIEQLNNNFNEKINQTKDTINNMFQTLQNGLLSKSYEFQQEDLKKFMELFQNAQNLEEIKHSLRGMLNRIVVDQGTVSGFVDQINRDSMIIDINQRISELQKILNEMNSQINKQFDKKYNYIENLSVINSPSVTNNIKESEKIETTSKKIIKNQDKFDFFVNFKFSEDFKHPCIDINRKTIINQNYTDQIQHYRVQLLQPSLEESLPKIQHWSFKITESLPNWIGFGIMHKDQAIKNDFQYRKQDFSISEGNINHGMYILCSNGWAFSHQQSPHRGLFGFTKGDTISLRFDPFMSILIFYKNGDYSEPFNLEFRSICWNKLYPCVVLWYPKDQIELL